MAELVRVSDFVKNFFEEKGVKHIFLLSGGMMMHLLDSLSRSETIKYVCNHHEQACAIAAEAYARVKNDIGVCYATSGPGATNTITGIAGAWLDSSPVIYLTGQSRTTLTARGAGIKDLRMLGNFEVDIVDIAKPITKYSIFVDDAKDIAYHLEKAYYTALEGRPGPVLLDIPLDIQGAMVNKDELKHFIPPAKTVYDVNGDFSKLFALLKDSKRPLIIAGHGIRVAKQTEHLKQILHHTGIPAVTTQLANDILTYDDVSYVGKVGLRGDRAGNFAVQSADLIISIGSSLHVTTTGYELEEFAPQANKVVIDIDKAVLEKNKAISQLQINCDVKSCLDRFDDLENLSDKLVIWNDTVAKWKKLFPIKDEPHPKQGDTINTYQLVDTLSESLKGDEIILSDAGSLYYITGQALKIKKDQRFIISGALGAMGYALPAAIGACFAEPEKNVICLTGDGSMQLNVQELQTISNYQLNCKIIVINNKGYASIRNSQVSFQGGQIAASSYETGVTFPDWKKLTDAYSIPYILEDNINEISKTIENLLKVKGPVFLEVGIPENVTMIPAVTSVRLPNGSFKANRLHEMTPNLSKEQLDNAGLPHQLITE
jgi:acetolactate synthase-1/2/3 large subunit